MRFDAAALLTAPLCAAAGRMRKPSSGAPVPIALW